MGGYPRNHRRQPAVFDPVVFAVGVNTDGRQEGSIPGLISARWQGLAE
jgi:hypothetical protein